jgi:hypothetical protein
MQLNAAKYFFIYQPYLSISSHSGGLYFMVAKPPASLRSIHGEASFVSTREKVGFRGSGPGWPAKHFDPVIELIFTLSSRIFHPKKPRSSRHQQKPQ